MPMTSEPPNAVRRLIDDGRNGRTNYRVVLRQLLEGGVLISACAEVLAAPSSWLDDLYPADEDLGPHSPAGADPAALGSLLELVRVTRPEDLPRACAIIYAARAVQSRRHNRGVGAVREQVAAVLAWDLASEEPSLDAPLRPPFPLPSPDADEVVLGRLVQDHPELPWEPVDDLMEYLEQGPPRVLRSISVPVVRGNVTELTISSLEADAVADPHERILPEPAATAFMRDLPPVAAELSVAFQWSRAREGFPRGRGIRWRIVGQGGEPVDILGPMQATAAGALAFGRLFPPPRRRLLIPRDWRAKQFNARVVVHAGMAPNGRLLPLGDVADAARTVVDSDYSLIVATDDDVVASPARHRFVGHASTVHEAARMTRQRGDARRWAAFATVCLLLATGLSVAGSIFNQRSRDELALRNARRLAAEAQQMGPDAPGKALTLALAAELLGPHTSDARAALLSSTDADSRIRQVVPTGLQNLQRLALNASASDVAAIGPDSRPHVWSTTQGTELPLPNNAPLAARTITFPSGAGPLAIGDDHGVALWDPTTPASPVIRLDAPRPVTATAYSPDGQMLAGGLDDGSILLWRPTSPKQSPQTIRPHHSPVLSLAFSPDGATVASTGSEGSALSSARSGVVERTVPVTGRGIAMSGECVFIIRTGTLEVYSADLMHQLHTPFTTVKDAGIAFSPLAGHLFLAATNGVVEFFADAKGITDNKTDKLEATSRALNPFASTGSIVALGGNGRYAAARTGSGSIVIYDLQEQTRRQVIAADVRAIYAVPNSALTLEVAGPPIRPVTLLLIDSRTARLQNYLTLPAPQRPGRSWDFSKQPGVVATAAGTTIATWLIRPGTGFQQLAQYDHPGEAAVSVIFDDTRHRMTAVWWHTIVVFDTSDPSRLKQLFSISVPSPGIHSAVLANNGQLLIIATTAGLYAIPLANKTSSWDHRIQLTSAPEHLVAARPDGSVIAGTLNGQASLFHPTGQTTLQEIPLQTSKNFQNILMAADDLILSISGSTMVVSDAATGRYLAKLITGADTIPVGAQYDSPVLSIFGDLPREGADVVLGRNAVREKACTLLYASRTLTLQDAWPQAPAAWRSRRLCP